MNETYFIADEQAMLDFGAQLAQRLPSAQTVIYLEGHLGAGKTTLVRGLLRALGHQGAVKSPTYTLVEPYQLGGRDIYHFDLYRLSDPEELEYMGIRDYLSTNALCLLEWPARGGDYTPKANLIINIKLFNDGRRVELETLSL